MLLSIDLHQTTRNENDSKKAKPKKMLLTHVRGMPLSPGRHTQRGLFINAPQRASAEEGSFSVIAITFCFFITKHPYS